MFKMVGVSGQLIPTDPANAGKAQGNARLMARGGLDALKMEGHHQTMLWFMANLPHGTKAVQCVGANKFVELGKFLIREAKIGLADGHELFPGPTTEGEVRI